MSPTYVVDTSVVVKWFNIAQEPFTTEALAVLAGAVQRRWKLFTSDLLVHELFNVLVRGKQLSWQTVEEAHKYFFTLPLTRVPTSAAIARSAARIASETGITVYDAVYVAVANELQTPLLSADRDHNRIVSGVRIVTLSTWK